MLGRFSAATIVLIVGAIFRIGAPFLHGLGLVISAHSPIVFPSDYLTTTQQDIATIITAVLVALHPSQNPPSPLPAPPPADVTRP